MIDALSLTDKCRGTAVVCNTSNGICISPSGDEFELRVIRDLDDIPGVNEIGGRTVLYFPSQKIAYKAKKKTGSMIIELLDEKLDGANEIILAGLHVIASWEFEILARNKWGYIYLPIDASFNGDFVPLYELIGKGVKVALGSGFYDARFDVCDYRSVVWACLINQYNILRDNRSILGVWHAALGSWRVYGLDEPGYAERLRRVRDPDSALMMIYLYARKHLEPEELILYMNK